LVTILAIAAKDFVDYWNHRAMHMKWLWPTHAAHHTDTHVNAFTAYRIHFLETLFMNLTYIVLLTWLQMPGAIPVVALLSLLHNQYVHLDLPFNHGPFKYLIASPVFHRWHHADVDEAYGKNLANMIPAYDVIFGTYYNPGPCTAPLGALKMGLADKNPFQIFIYPAIRWGELVRESLARRGRFAGGQRRRADR
jgi:sterol desaturase/sphingolipid hydroxylase (fatty acid hydroxylase superfamily)